MSTKWIVLINIMSIGSFLRPSSSSTITDLPPAPNSQIPTQPISQAQPDILEKRDTEGLSRPATACQDSQTLNQLLPPKRDLPFSKPAAKKPRTTKRQGDRTSTGMIQNCLLCQLLITDYYVKQKFNHQPQIRNQQRPEPRNPPPPTREALSAALPLFHNRT